MMRVIELEKQLLHYAHLLVGCPILARELVSQSGHCIDNPEASVLSERVTKSFLAVKQESLRYLDSRNASCGEAQLELFAEDEIAGAVSNVESKKEHLSARSRVFIGSLSDKERKLFFLGSKSANSLWANSLKQFFLQLSREHENGYYQIALKEKSEALQRVISYLISVGGDEVGLEVERKCREHPDWQTIKVQVSIALELLENAILNWGEVDELYQSKEEIDEEGNAEHVPLDDFSTESDQKSNELQNAPKHYQHWKIYLYTGLAASLIGYSGWLERLNLQSSLTLAETGLPELNGTRNSENLLIEQVGDLIAGIAQKKADDLLAERLVLQIAEVNQSMVVPVSSLTPRTYSDEGVTEERKEGEIDQDVVLIRELLEVQTGTLAQLFFPQGEALGKIRIEKVEQKEIFFQRVDWQNPQLSFALAQRSYEVRYRHPEYGEVIFSGYVRRGEKGTKPPMLYILSLEKAWMLTAEQKRIPVSPSFR